MKLARTFVATVGVVLVAALLFHNSRRVSASPSRRSEFIGTYDPSGVIAKFGGLHQSIGGFGNAAGRHGVWNSWHYVFRMAVEPDRVPELLAALHRNVEDSIKSHGSRVAGQSIPTGSSTRMGEAIYETRYEDAHATGVVRIGPAYPDKRYACDATTFAVPVWIDEQWVPE